MNIILFLYDSLIAPMLSSFGGSAPTPAFDFFANTGARFKKTAAHSLRSDVALGTILTGSYPHHNGIHKLITENHASATNLGYLYDDENSLVLSAYWNGYRVRIFNCDELNQCTKKTVMHNFPVTAPHMGQLEHFVNESREGPFLLVDRFRMTGFGWHHAQSKDWRDSNAEYRELALRGLESPNSRSLIIRRMQDAVMREDERLMLVIKMLHRYSLMDNSVVVIAGMPGDVNKEEKKALNRLSGYNEDNTLYSPTIIWCPKKIKPAFSETKMIRHIDIAPTLTALSGIKTSYEMDGRDILTVADNKKGSLEETLTFYDDSIELDSNGNISAMPLASADSDGNGDSPAGAESRLMELLDNPSVVPKQNDLLLNDNVILKSTIFFLGVPRSGTTFFSRFFLRPEFKNVEGKGHHSPLPLYAINALHNSSVIDSEKVKNAIGALRDEINSYQKETLVVVSHDHYAIIPILAELFVNSKFVFMVRDPRTFVTSASSLPNMIQSVGANSLHQPEHLMQPWHKFEPNDRWVEKVSRSWNNMARQYFDEGQKLGKRALTVKFEDVFDADKNYPDMRKIIEFIKDDVRIPDEDDWLKNVLGVKTHSFNYSFPVWEKWSKKDKDDLINCCGKTMSLLGYDINSAPKT